MQSTETRRDTPAPWTIVEERLIDCPFSLVLDEAHVVLPLFASPSFVRIRFRDLGLPLRGNFIHSVVANSKRQPDESERGRAHDEIDFAWSAPSWWLPNFHAVLRFRIEATKTRLTLSGRYRPPFGPVGWVFDRIVGRRLARATVTDLLDRLAIALESAWRDIKREAAAVEATHELHMH